MSKFSRILALSLVFVMVFAVSLNAGAITYTDSTDKPIDEAYQSATDLLGQLGIMNGFEDGSFRPEESVTRAQFLKMLYVITNRGKNDNASLYNDLPITFGDVRKGEWYNGYVRWGVGREVISGRSSYVFDPKGNVTGYEALKMALTTLGYDQDLESFIGNSWKRNVLNVAQEAGLLESLNISNMDAPISRQEAAQILNNALFSDMVNYNTNYVPAKMEKDVTMAMKYFTLDIVRAVVVSNEWAALEGTINRTGESTVWIDGDHEQARTIPFSAPMDTLGREVIFYAKVKSVNNNSVTAYDKIYGTMTVTSRNDVQPIYSDADASDEGDIENYLTHSDYLGRSSASVEGFVIDYQDVAKNSGTNATDAKAGSLITFIDNDRDGSFEYAIAVSYNYAKVTAVKDGKITAQAGNNATSAFTGTKLLSGTKVADVMNGADLKENDRVLLHKIGTKWNAIKVEPLNGTLTASKKDGKVAVINGKDYAQSVLATRVTDINSVLATQNFNAARDYYICNNQIMEATVPAAATRGYALLKDSYITGSSSFNSQDARVSLVLDDNTQGVYKLNAIIRADGTDAKLDIGTASVIEWDDSDILPDSMWQYEVSDDNTSVTLFVPAGNLANRTPSEVSYTNGATSITLAAPSTTKAVLDSTVFFVKNSSNASAPTYAAYKGRTMPTTGGLVTVKTYNGNLDGSLNNSGSALRAAFVDSTTMSTYAIGSKNFAVLLDRPQVNYNGVTKKYYATMRVWNGSEVAVLTVADDVRSGTYIDFVVNGLTPSNLGASKGDVIEYAIGADGKVSRFITNTVDAPVLGTNGKQIVATKLPDATGFFAGYYVYADSSSVQMFDGTGSKSRVISTKDAKIYSIDLTTGTAETLTSLNPVNAQDAAYIIVRYDATATTITHMWVIEDHDTFNTAP